MAEIIGGLDYPIENTRVKNVVYVHGWGFYSNNCDPIFEIYINDRMVDSGIGQFPRFDIFQKFKKEEAYTSGFIARVDLRQESDGPLFLEVKCKVNDSKKLIGKIGIIKDSKFSTEVKNPLPLGSVGSGIRKVNIGEKDLEFLINLGKLNSSDNILDIGCGMGGVAIALTKYLSDGTKYEGLDISPTVINYCNDHINKRFSNFHFSLIDINNKMYNPDGKYEGSNYKFSFDDKSFDFIFLTSVFTHLNLEVTENYLNEISRMLKPEGRCYMSFHLLNKEIENRIDRGLARLTFKNQFDGFRAQNKNTPERNIAFKEEIIKKLLEDNDLILNQIHYGKWSGYKNGITNQDVIVVTKK